MKRRKTKAGPKRKVAKRRPVRKRKVRPTQAIVRVEAERRASGEFSPDAIALLKRTLAKDCNEDEFAFYLWVAKKHHLDPFTRQLHVVKRFSTQLQQDVMTIQIGIDGYRFMAARSHPDYGGTDEPEYEFEADGKTLKLARIRVWKKGFEHPTVGIAFWTEYCPADLSSRSAFMWKKMPRLMLAKCAEALALRKAYPDLADIYTDEEMAQTRDQFTAAGRRILTEPGPDAAQIEVAKQAGIAVPRNAQEATEAQKLIAERRIKELQQQQAQIEAEKRKAFSAEIASLLEEFARLDITRGMVAVRLKKDPGNATSDEVAILRSTLADIKAGKAQWSAQKEEKPSPKPSGDRPINDKELTVFWAAVKTSWGWSDKEVHAELMGKFGMRSVKEIPKSRLDEIMKYFQDNRADLQGTY